MRPAIQRIRDRFQTVWEVSSLSIRIHLVNQGLGVAFVNSKLLQEHPVCKQFAIMKSVPYSDIERQVGIYYKVGKTLSTGAENFIAICKNYCCALFHFDLVFAIKNLT